MLRGAGASWSPSRCSRSATERSTDDGARAGLVVGPARDSARRRARGGHRARLGPAPGLLRAGIAPDRAARRRARRDRGAAARSRAAARVRRRRSSAKPREAGERVTATPARAATCASWRRSRSTRSAHATSTTRSRPRTPDGGRIRVWVHIADVAAHVRDGLARWTARRASARRASTPRAPSSRCCRTRSPATRARCGRGVDRAAVTVEMELDGAEVVSAPRSTAR